MVVTGILARGREHPHIMYIIYIYIHYFPHLRPTCPCSTSRPAFVYDCIAMSASLQNISPRYQEPPRISIVALIWLAQSFALLDDVGWCGPWKNMMCNLLVEIEFRIVFLLFSCCMKKSLVGGGTVSSSIFFWVRSISMWIPNNGIHWSRWLRLIGTSDV